MAKKDRTLIKLDLKKEWELGKGHTPRRSGAGPHQDKRVKRLNTRKSQIRKAIEENS